MIIPDPISKILFVVLAPSSVILKEPCIQLEEDFRRPCCASSSSSGNFIKEAFPFLGLRKRVACVEERAAHTRWGGREGGAPSRTDLVSGSADLLLLSYPRSVPSLPRGLTAHPVVCVARKGDRNSWTGSVWKQLRLESLTLPAIQRTYSERCRHRPTVSVPHPNGVQTASSLSGLWWCSGRWPDAPAGPGSVSGSPRFSRLLRPELFPPWWLILTRFPPGFDPVHLRLSYCL